MEFILGAVVIIFLLALAGVDIVYILLGVLALISLAAVFTAGFFAVCLVTILRGSRKKGYFCGFRRGRRGEAAVYLIDGAEHTNAFPAEFVLRDRIYRPDRAVRLCLARDGRVFDVNALTTVFAGLPMSAALAAALTRIVLLFLAGM